MKKIMDDKILAYIETHLDMEYGQDDIAEAFGYSTDHFRHLFRMYYDMPLGDIYAGGGFSKQQPGLGTENRLGMPRQCMVLRQQLDLPKPLRRNLVFLPVN